MERGHFLDSVSRTLSTHIFDILDHRSGLERYVLEDTDAAGIADLPKDGAELITLCTITSEPNNVGAWHDRALVSVLHR